MAGVDCVSSSLPIAVAGVRTGVRAKLTRNILLSLIDAVDQDTDEPRRPGLQLHGRVIVQICRHDHRIAVVLIRLQEMLQQRFRGRREWRGRTGEDGRRHLRLFKIPLRHGKCRGVCFHGIGVVVVDECGQVLHVDVCRFFLEPRGGQDLRERFLARVHELIRPLPRLPKDLVVRGGEDQVHDLDVLDAQVRTRHGVGRGIHPFSSRHRRMRVKGFVVELLFVQRTRIFAIPRQHPACKSRKKRCRCILRNM